MASPVADSYSAASGATIYAGRSGLPAWVPAANTVATIPEANTFASIDPGNSAANGWNYNALGEYFPNNWDTIINDFSGGVYNPYLGPLGSMIFHGGGHAASNWNGIVAFDLATLAYSIWLGGCTNCYPIDTTNGEYADGQPLSPHSYDYLTIIGPEAGYPKGALLTPLVFAGAFESYDSTAAHLFDFNNPGAKWTRLAASVSGYSISPGGAAAYDADLGRVWWVCNQNQLGWMAYFDLATSAHIKISMTYAQSLHAPEPNTQSMRYDHDRHLLICTYTLTGTTTRNVSYFDTQDPPTGWKEATLSATIDAGNSAFDKAADGKYYIYVGSATDKLHRFTVPATLTDTWPVETITPGGTAFVTGNILGKRWSYIPALQAFVCKFTATTAHQVYRP